MSATAVKADGAVLATATTIGGAAAGAAVLTYQAVPTTPIVTSTSAQDGYIQVNFTTESAIDLILSGDKAICDIIVNSTEAGIETFTGLIASITRRDAYTHSG